MSSRVCKRPDRDNRTLRSPKSPAAVRPGFTIIELLVVMAIITILSSLILAGVQRAREVANRVKCANNLRQMGIALHDFNATYQHFPSGGQGTDVTQTPPAATYDLHSLFTMLLPYLDHADIYQQFDLRYAYNDPPNSSPNKCGQNVVTAFLCPSNSLRPRSGADANGYGYTDYGPTVYTDIDPTTGVRNKWARTQGGLYATSPVPFSYTPGTVWSSGGSPLNMTSFGPAPSDNQDGLSNTIAIAEDSGRNENMSFLPAENDPLPTSPPNAFRKDWRWAEPASGFGVSGDPMFDAKANVLTDPADGTVATQPGIIRAVNNNFVPFGGGACPWNTGHGQNTNCGPNNEVFSPHGAGANVVFMDGHVYFLSDNTDPVVMRRLVTSVEGLPVPAGANY